MVYRPESLVRRVEKLREYARDLDDLAVPDFGAYEGNKTNRYAVERLLVLVAEVVIDVLDHLLSARHSVISDGYEEVLANARANALISEELYGRLKGLGGLRNALTHRYLTMTCRCLTMTCRRSRRLSRSYRLIGGGLPDVDDVNRFAVRGFRGIHDALGERRMRVNREPDILERRAHLERDHALADQ